MLAVVSSIGTDGWISVDSAANLLEVVGNRHDSVDKDEAEVFRLYPRESDSTRNGYRQLRFPLHADRVSIDKSPERNFLTDFGSPPIPSRSFYMAKGDFRNISLQGNDKIKSREREAILSKFILGSTRPLPGHSITLPGHSIIGSVGANSTSSWRASTPTESNKGGSVPVICQKQDTAPIWSTSVCIARKVDKSILELGR
ncbi:hypothetical protein TNCV_3240861 [Trichonephila clavipes]|nr:hypothetical protein TNCV_3240861 [Trichonephila clavipes]